MRRDDGPKDFRNETMNRSNNNHTPLSLETPIDEERVRRALGLSSSGAPHQQRPEQARQRHRFVADGAVPVVMLNRVDGETTGLKERLAAAEIALENERAAHAGTRRLLHDAQSAHQALQTRFGHTELALNETLKAEREARRTAEDSLAALRVESAERPAPVPVQLPVSRVKSADAAPRKVRATAAKEPKPVRWWTPSYSAKQR